MIRLPLLTGLYGGKHSLQNERLLMAWDASPLKKKAHIYAVLAEEITHFQLPTVDSVSAPAGQPQAFLPVRPHRPWCHNSATKRTTALRTPRDRAASGGRVRKDANSRWVSSTHGSSVMLSRRSVISIVDWLSCADTSLVSFGSSAEDLPVFADLFLLVTETSLGASVMLGADVVFLPIFLVFVT